MEDQRARTRLLARRRPALGKGREARAPGSALRAAGSWHIILLGAAIFVLGLGALAVMWLLRRPLALLLAGIVVAQSLAPLVAWLERKLPRILAVLLVYLVLLLIVAGIAYVVVPPFVGQAQAAVDQLPERVQRLQDWLAQYGVNVSQDTVGTLYQQLGSISSTLLRLPLMIVSSLFDLIVILFVSIYWLIQTPGMWRFVLSLVPPKGEDRFKQVAYQVGKAMGGYLRGTAIDGLIIGTATFIGLSLIGVDYPLVLGLVTALLEFVPVLGAVISAILIVLVALVHSFTTALIALGFAVVLQQVENHVLVPNVMHSQTNISPLLAVLAVVAGGSLGGLLGAVISIPLAAALQVLVSEVVAPAIRSRTGAAPVETGGNE